MRKILSITILVFICVGIAALVIPNWLYKRSEARSYHNLAVVSTENSIQTLSTLVYLYKHQNEQFPESLQSLIPNYLNKLPKDIWAKDFLYYVENGKAVIMTYGADGKIGGKGLNYDFSNNIIRWVEHYK